jgi:hypothetical protein
VVYKPLEKVFLRRLINEAMLYAALIIPAADSTEMPDVLRL